MMKNRKKLAIILIVCGVLLFATGITSALLLNAKVRNDKAVDLYIYPASSSEEVLKQLKEKGVLESTGVFSFFTKALSDKATFRSGHYTVQPKASQLELAKQLVRGLQTPVKLVIGKVRTQEELAEKMAKQLMISSSDIGNAILKTENSSNIFDYIVPNTYEVYWNIGAEQLLQRLKRESDKWWSGKDKQLKRLGLSRHEAVVLASIVEEETNKNEEKPIIAGVYVNRLRRGMLLQADPTVKYAVGDFTIKRVMYKHLQTDSPYNTYMYKGLPPTAICLPEQSSLNAVLGYAEHNYVFFCAKDDFSGYHNFAETSAEHYANADRYRAALNREGIK